MHTTLIQAPELQALLRSSADVRVFDCSFELSDPTAGERQYAEGHLPGALHADLERHLSLVTEAGTRLDPALGRHPLPDRGAFARWLGQCGVSPRTQVVVYDRQGSAFACRLWWMLKWCGHEAVAVLDGGLKAWQAAGGECTADHTALSSDATHNAPAYPLADSLALLKKTTDVAQALGRPGQTLIDARASARFRGETEPLDPVAGHIPGALNRPYTENFEADGRFKPAAALREGYTRLLGGRDPATVVHQCGSGVTAIPNLLAMEISGLGSTALYAGSWSAWCNTPHLPCAQG